MCYNDGMAGKEREPLTKFGRMLRALRHRERPAIPQDAMGPRLGVSAAMYGRYERGYVVPPAETVEAMATACGADVDEWLSAAGYEGYEIAESTPTHGLEAREKTPPGYVGQIPGQDSPTIGTVGDDGLVDLEQTSEGLCVFTLYVLAESLGRYHKGDRLICQAGTTPGRHPCIVKETDGSLRLVRRARRKGDGLEVQPLSALGQHKFQAMAGEVVAVVIRRWNDE